MKLSVKGFMARKRELKYWC